MSKVKILIAGSVQDHYEILVTKLNSLQSSKAGPFDACFCVGTIHVPENRTEDLPLPVYVQEYSGTVGATSKDNNIVSLGHNLFHLHGSESDNNKSVNIIPVQLASQDSPLMVGCCSRHVRADPPAQQKQCDLLFTSDWPQGMEDVCNVDTEPLSFDVAQVALNCRPRYHIAPSTQQYHVSPPYHLPNSDHVGRFLSLAPVVPGKPTKTTKFIHALGLIPLAANPPPTTTPSTLPCPFLTSKDEEQRSRTKTPKFAVPTDSAGGPSYRFATNNKRSRKDHDDANHTESLEPPDDPSVNKLFLYGLHKDVTGELQSTSSAKVLHSFSKFDVVRVRHPPNTSTSTYCFLEFPNQQKALDCLLDCQGRITIDSVDLTLKWATQNSNNKKPRRHEPERHYVTHDEAPNSTTLYFHPPKKISPRDSEDGNDELTKFAQSLCNYLQTTLEESLNEGNDDGERVTAETEPALAVKVRTKDHYGFLEFASHAAPLMALAAVTTSTDGGLVVAEPESAPKPPDELKGTTLRWAKGEQKPQGRDQVLEALGLQRQYYSADTRTDCWFCLASPTCETHLIAAVYNEWYATMPKGPVHPGHVLLVPVTHTSQGAWTLGTEEWTELVQKLQQHALEAYDCDLLIFERAMETKGGYHTHINCVPVPRDCTTKLRTTMVAHAKASGFDLRDMQSDLTIASMITKKDSYFYAELHTKTQSHRFLYKQQEDSGNSSSVVPLQFAREVLASVLQNPKLAHWKACVVDKEQESKLATDFRESFAIVCS